MMNLHWCLVYVTISYCIFSAQYLYTDFISYLKEVINFYTFIILCFFRTVATFNYADFMFYMKEVLYVQN